MKAKVYFSREITPEKVVEMYRALGVELQGPSDGRLRRRAQAAVHRLRLPRG